MRFVADANDVPANAPEHFSIGPFHYDQKAKTVTLSPGVYTLTEPLIIPSDTVISGVEYVYPKKG